jgi:hypothetical protein
MWTSFKHLLEINTYREFPIFFRFVGVARATDNPYWTFFFDDGNRERHEYGISSFPSRLIALEAGYEFVERINGIRRKKGDSR